MGHHTTHSVIQVQVTCNPSMVLGGVCNLHITQNKIITGTFLEHM